MSNPEQRAMIWLSCLVAGFMLHVWPFPESATSSAAAQESPIDAWARWVAGHGQWKGPVVPFPDQAERPGRLAWVARSWMRPVVVHAPASVAWPRVQNALAALEHAYDVLGETGWPEVFPDGGYGQTAGFDLYLTPGMSAPAVARVDTPVTWSSLDGAATHALLDPDLSTGLLEPCVVAALTQAVLLGQDPAEPVAWRRATGAYVAWLATGFFGCDDSVTEQQQNPWRGWITDASGSGAGGALFLAMLSEREDGGSGTFVRELWQFARQKTQQRGDLRGSPNLWEVTVRALENAGESLDQIVQDIAVSRFFAGPEARRRAAPYFSLRTLPEEAAVPVPAPIPLSKLPRHLPPAHPPVETFGSAYAAVDTVQAALPMELKIWLRAEPGTRWALSAVRVADDGKEHGRVSAPATRNPNSYVSVELDKATVTVLIVVTNLGAASPKSDRAMRQGRSFRLILDASSGPGTDY